MADISSVSTLDKERSPNSLLWFGRFGDTATLIKTALCDREYKSLIHSTAVTELQSSGLYTLKQLADSFLPQGAIASYSCETQWREWYFHVVRRLKSEGIKTPEDIEAGADEYVSLRREWNDEVAAFAKHMAYRWRDVAPAESAISASAFLPLKNSPEQK